MAHNEFKDKILDTKEHVFGYIYIMRNSKSGFNYIGQVVSHRKNKGKYKPFGIEGRFKDHISEAINNTKKKQCTFLNNAIRKDGSSSFTVQCLEECSLNDMHIREQYYIHLYNTIAPNGYNLTIGGKTTYTESVERSSPLKNAKKRGGCKSRSESTREKMSIRLKEVCSSKTRKLNVSTNTKKQHYAKKLERFKECVFESDRLEDYILETSRGISVRVGTIETYFTSKHETVEEMRVRALSFLQELYQLRRYQIDGKPLRVLDTKLQIERL